MQIPPRIRDFMCVNSNPSGCYRNVQQEIIYSKIRRKPCKKLNALVIGSSMGYGLSARISMAFSGNYNTIGICLEKKASYKKTGSAGWYNTLAFESMAREESVYSKSINGDSFSYETKMKTADIIREKLKKIDIVVYSLASPKRLNPENGKTYNSVIKPILNPLVTKKYDRQCRSRIIEPVSSYEMIDTLNTMGGDDWVLWIMYLLKEGLLADNFRTVAFSYIGPATTYPIYKHGSIGIAKDNVVQASSFLNKVLKKVMGKSSVAVNQSIITQSSAVIPTIPSYISFLNSALSRSANEKNSIKQMHRLIFKELYSKFQTTDALGRIRLDAVEVCERTQNKVLEIGKAIKGKAGNTSDMIESVRKDFAKIFGFKIQ